MARRRKRRRKTSYENDGAQTAQGSSSALVAADLSPRARKLVEGGVIDLDDIAGSGDAGRITSGDILHAARLMEVEQSVARIEVAYTTEDADGAETGIEVEQIVDPTEGDHADIDAADEDIQPENTAESATFTAVAIRGEPIEVEPTPWDDYNGTTEGLSASALPGADQSWGEAEAHLSAMADEAAARELTDVTPTPGASHEHEFDNVPLETSVAELKPVVTEPDPDQDSVLETAWQEHSAEESAPEEEIQSLDSGEIAPVAIETVAAAESASPTEVMMDFGTLEVMDPDSVWEQGAEDFAPWFLAHSQQLGDVLGLEQGLSDARQFTTSSATGVLGVDDNGQEVVVVSSKTATADDSDLGRALGMAASSGAASVALVTATLHEDQLKALAWLNNQTKSGVKWYGIEMRVVRIADSPAAMLFELVASPT